MRHNTDPGSDFTHAPVMWREVLEYIDGISVAGDSCFLDCTLGEGGHSELILKNYPETRIIGFERDPEILEIARKRLKVFGDRIKFINDNFTNISKFILLHIFLCCTMYLSKYFVAFVFAL